MTAPAIDVLIVGGGPVGTALAIDLTRRGLAVRIIDKADHGFDGSRAKGLQPRTLEILDDLGALDDILAGGAQYPLLGIHLGPVTVPWRMVRSPYSGDESVPFPHTWLIPQSRTDQALRDRLSRLGANVEYQCELIELSQTPDDVHASINTPEGVHTITARYVVGADGGGSTVRKQAGIGFSGSTDEADRMLIVDAAVSGGLSRDRWHIWPGRSGRFTGACPLPHGEQFQWMIRLNADEAAPLDAEGITQCIRAHTRNQRLAVHDITWSSVFRPNVRLAENYRLARVFLAGDAAHVHTPFGGQGLNTGVQDAYNLGWKLGQVIAGAPPELLDTYEAERLPIAAAVLGLSTKKYDGMAKGDPATIKRGKDEQQIALTYRGGPLAPSTAPRTATLQVGDRTPDARVHDSTGKELRLFDAYRGPQFTALACGPRAAAELDQLNWPAGGAALQRITVDADTDTDTEGFRKIYGIDSEAMILIRPDGYIGGIATQEMSAIKSTVAALTPPA